MTKYKNCSFCNNEITIENIGIEGLNACICRDCLELYHQLVMFEDDEKHRKIKRTKNKRLTPKIIYDELDKEIIGQKEAKKKIAVALFLHYLRINNPDLKIEKSNILMIGPTGTGKTFLAKTMAKIIDVPIAICDATVYTQAGYVGEDVENILLRLIQNADYDIELAESGIVFIDEFDKLARKSESVSITRDVSGEGVQNSLLKIIEGNVINVPPQGGRKHPYQEYIKINTENILFICAGAFDGLDENKTNKVGFNSSSNEDELIDSEKLQKYGIIPEILGRLPIIAKLDSLTINELKQILTKPSNSITSQYKKIFDACDVELSFLDDGLENIAKCAKKEKSGARALRKIIDELLLDSMFDLPFVDGTKKLEISSKEIKKINK